MTCSRRATLSQTATRNTTPCELEPPIMRGLGRTPGRAARARCGQSVYICCPAPLPEGAWRSIAGEASFLSFLSRLPYDRPFRVPDHTEMARYAFRQDSALFAAHAKWRQGL